MIRTLTCFLPLIILCFSCNNTPVSQQTSHEFYELSGEAQGTTFNIKYYGKAAQDYSNEIENILVDIDKSMSLWVNNSEINSLNKDSSKTFTVNDPHGYFQDVFQQSKIVYHSTGGYFDPSIDKLIEALGFGVNKPALAANSLDENGRNSFSFNDSVVYISDVNASTFVLNKSPNTSLNFNAIAQGYSVDAVALFLDEMMVENYYVEIGGELKTKGKNMSNNYWSVGIDRPQSGDRKIDHVIEVKNESIATSGSYRKFIVKDGKKYSHTINPITKKPVDHNLLSVTVKTQSCAQADGYATAFMAMGMDKTIVFIEKNESLDIDVFLIYDVNGKLETYTSSNFSVKAL